MQYKYTLVIQLCFARIKNRNEKLESIRTFHHKVIRCLWAWRSVVIENYLVFAICIYIAGEFISLPITQIDVIYLSLLIQTTLIRILIEICVRTKLCNGVLLASTLDDPCIWMTVLLSMYTGHEEDLLFAQKLSKIILSFKHRPLMALVFGWLLPCSCTLAMRRT